MLKFSFKQTAESRTYTFWGPILYRNLEAIEYHHSLEYNIFYNKPEANESLWINCNHLRVEVLVSQLERHFRSCGISLSVSKNFDWDDPFDSYSAWPPLFLPGLCHLSVVLLSEHSKVLFNCILSSYVFKIF